MFARRMDAELDIVEIAAFQALALACAVALPWLYLAWAQRAHPWLDLRVHWRVVLHYAVPVVLWSIPPGAVVAIVIGDPRRAALVTIAIGIVYAWRRSPATDVFAAIRIFGMRVKGDFVAMNEAAAHAVERLARHRTLVGPKLAHGIVQVVASAGLIEDADRILSSMPREKYFGTAAWFLQHALAMLRLRLGNIDRVAETLDACKGLAPDADVDREHRFLRALVDTANGNAESAWKRMRDDDDAVTLLVVDAHAFASVGKEAEARQALERLLARPDGEAELEALGDFKLPARTLILRLLRNEKKD